MLNLLVTFNMRSGDREPFIDEMVKAGILEKVRAEKGCHYYDFYSALQKPDILLLLEEWEDEDCQKAHIETDHMAQFREIKKKYVETTTIKTIEYK